MLNSIKLVEFDLTYIISFDIISSRCKISNTLVTMKNDNIERMIIYL